MVVVHVIVPKSRRVGGPVGRAKTALDALMDDERKTPPFYRDYEVGPPLPNDAPDYVHGLAVEVRAFGAVKRTEYRLAPRLLFDDSRRLATCPVACAAPNDTSAGGPETTRIRGRRKVYATAVNKGWRDSDCDSDMAMKGRLLRVRHQRGRNQDNTWRTWGQALCGAVGQGRNHWASGAPLRGWSPTSVASLIDDTLNAPVRYEIY
jgi:hypothetical protein